MKRCTKCGSEKLLAAFSRNARTKDGLRHTCRLCNKQMAQEWYQATRTTRLAVGRAWAVANPYKVRARYRRYYYAHLDRVRAKNRKVRATHLNLYRARERDRRAANLARERARKRANYAANPNYLRKSQEWRVLNPERTRQTSRRWALNNPDYAAVTRQRRRAARIGAVTTLTIGEWKILKDEFGYRCAYCGDSHVRLAQDHIQAVRSGGVHTYENIVPACRSCNARKGARSLEQFMKRHFPVVDRHQEVQR